MKQINFINAIQSLGFDGVCSFSDIPKSQEDVDVMFRKQVSTDTSGSAVMEVGNCPFTYAELEAERQRLQTIEDAKAYQFNRAKAYPSLAEQMDMQYWDSVNGTTVWADTIAAIKQEYPKP
jgi:hypothetical protein